MPAVSTNVPPNSGSKYPSKKRGGGGRPPNLQKQDDFELDADSHRVIPHDLDAEKAILSSMLQAPNECVGEAMVKLNENQFYSQSHQILYGIIVELFDQGKPVDPIAVTGLLRDRSQLELIGGASELAEILTFAPSAAHFQYFADVVRDKFVLRQVIKSSNEHISAAYEEVPNVLNYLDSVEAEVLAIREGIDSDDGIKPMRKHLLDTIQEIEDSFNNRDETTGISTGYEGYDKMTNGLHGGEMTIIAARPSMGKTSFAMNIVENVAIKQGHPCAVFSLEMSAQSLVQRLLCANAQVEMNKVRSGMLSQKRDFPKIQMAAARLAQSNIFIDDTPSLSIMAMRAKARRLKKQHDIQMIMVDYLQLMRSESKRAQDNRQQEVAEISSGCKAIAKELDVPIIVLAQLNRGPETRTGSNRPRLSDLRESGSIEQDADVCGLLVRELYYAENDDEREAAAGKATFIIAKQRNGATGDVGLTFRKELMRFEDRALEEGEGEE